MLEIIFAFDDVLTERGFGFNVGLCVFTVLKIFVSLWILWTDSDKNECVLKWQTRFMFVISAIAAFLGGGVKLMKKGGTFYAANATRGN
jgi:hypothetical protein